LTYLDYQIDHGCDINAIDDRFVTIKPLQLSFASDISGNVTRRLLELGASPRQRAGAEHAPYSTLEELALAGIGAQTLPLLKAMVDRGCTYPRNAAAFRMLYRKAILWSQPALAHYILSQDQVTQEVVEKNFLADLLKENTQSCISAVETLVDRRDPVPFMVGPGSRKTALHVLASAKEDGRNDSVNERLTRFVLARYGPEQDLLDAKDASGMTAVELAVETGNHRVLRCLVEVGASTTCGRYNVPAAMVMRITDISRRLPEGDKLPVRLRRDIAFERRIRSTTHLLQVIHEFQPEMRLLGNNLEQANSYDVFSNALRKWSKPEVWKGSALRAAKAVFGDDATAESVRPNPSEFIKRMSLSHHPVPWGGCFLVS
jgi:hypothetical protein